MQTYTHEEWLAEGGSFNRPWTPGQWCAVGSVVEHEDDDKADICACHPDAMGQGHLARSYTEIVANSRLISSAPWLFDTLLRLVEVNLEACGDCFLLDEANPDCAWCEAHRQTLGVLSRIARG